MFQKGRMRLKKREFTIQELEMSLICKVLGFGGRMTM
jgi:hypothetical protein